ncbi:MAG TPA: stage II sporulation protein R [Clostridia bacterium]
MKQKIIYIVLVGFCILLIFLVNFTIKDPISNTKDYIRLHIRANSNSAEDQNVKYKVKEAVLSYLTPKLAQCNDFDDVYKIVQNAQDDLKTICLAELKKNDFYYDASVSLHEEYFPAREYDGYVFPDGIYNALIINLGTGEGDNWWCVVYPPLCFLGADEIGYQNIKYKSKIYELIQQWKNKK